MDAGSASEAAPVKHRTTVERKSDREMLVTRIFDAPAAIVFEAWTTPALFKQWWVPKSAGITLLSCEADVRPGGKYRLEFAHPAFPTPMPFFGTYLEVTPPFRLAWSNEESPDGAVTTVTFEERDGKTLVVVHELYPTKEALEAQAGSEDAMPEQFAQLDAVLVAIGAAMR